ncbi:pilus assembly protein TadG-related protein [Tabrizicola sp.]|uniref:TadE/TadG family type IV pilus assembly protein n=1 Tax=Tabrizicola sp. TaxID=2005166 RepID=UPI003F2BDBAB
MLNKLARRPVSAHVARKFSEFKRDEGGGVTLWIVMLFTIMFLFGGIAVDVMRYEMRRVALQETMDRATLAAANLVLPPSETPASVAQDWIDKSGLGDELTVDYTFDDAVGTADDSTRSVKLNAKVRSYNHFIGVFYTDIHYFEGPVVSAAQQGAEAIEVMMVLDVTGSMGEASGTTTKIAALRTAATNFVNILKENDADDMISIGLVPYASQVNIPVGLRNQFTNLTNLSSWDGVANAGVPGINCIEIPTDTYSSTALSTARAMPMAAVADVTYNKPTSATINRTANPVAPNMGSNEVICNKSPDVGSTAADESLSNLVLLPTMDGTKVTDQLALLQPRGRTSIAVGMRWGTALIDQSAAPIYENLITEPAMADRPALNTNGATRKIIVVMTDGNHVASDYILDAYKSGPSPIWRGTDGQFAIKYASGGAALTGGARPTNCSGWSIPASANREYFLPHMKDNSETAKVGATEIEGLGTGLRTTGACDPNAWIAAPTWAQTVNDGPDAGDERDVVTVPDGSDPDTLPDVVMITATQLDWSEVWRYARVDWVIEQLYMRSGVDGTSNYDTVYNMFVGDYLTNNPTMDALLNTNCKAAKDAGIEVFGIVLGDAVNPVPIQNCSSPGTGYFYLAKDPGELNNVFKRIADLIDDLRLTQ